MYRNSNSDISYNSGKNDFNKEGTILNINNNFNIN